MRRSPTSPAPTAMWIAGAAKATKPATTGATTMRSQRSASRKVRSSSARSPAADSCAKRESRTPEAATALRLARTDSFWAVPYSPTS